MKITSRSLVLIAIGVAGGLCLGVLLQKFFPMGRTLLKLRQLAGSAEVPTAEQAFVLVSQAADPEILALADQTTVTPRPAAIEERQATLRNEIATRIPAEEVFSKSAEVKKILTQLRAARQAGETAEIEWQFDRVFPESHLPNLEKVESRSPKLAAYARRIAKFSQLLARGGTHLIYSPAPNPLDCALPQLVNRPTPCSARPDHSRFLLELLDLGVDVIDLRPHLQEMAGEGRPPYHRFDHHWTPAGIEEAAASIAEEIGTRFEISSPFSGPDGLGISYRRIPILASSWNLDLAPPRSEPGTLFGREVLLGGIPMRSVPRSPIWVMGDSFLLENSPSRSGISADFGSHLAGRLGAPVNTLGRPGTADIRMAYFLATTLTGTRPKLLIWLHSDDDFRLPEIDPESLSAATSAITGMATILEVTPLPDPKTTPYPSALFSFRAEIELPREKSMEVMVYTWAFQERALTPLAVLEPEDTREMTLRPWLKAVESEAALGTARVIDHLDNLRGVPIFWLDP